MRCNSSFLLSLLEPIMIKKQELMKLFLRDFWTLESLFKIMIEVSNTQIIVPIHFLEIKFWRSLHSVFHQALNFFHETFEHWYRHWRQLIWISQLKWKDQMNAQNQKLLIWVPSKKRSSHMTPRYIQYNSHTWENKLINKYIGRVVD